MSSSARTNSQQQQNQQSTGSSTYDFFTPPDTADIQAQRGFQFQSDPRIGYSFARQRRQAHESFDNPFGANSTASLRDATLRASDEDSAQNEAQAYREENYNRQGLDYARLADVASLTQPRMAQTSQTSSSSGTASGTTTQQQPLLPGLIQGASGVGSALIM